RRVFETKPMATPQPKERSNDVLEQTSFLYGANAAFVEGLYAQYLADPNSVDETWRSFFSGLVERMAERRPSWGRTDWPEPDETTRALTGAPAPKAEAKGAKSAPGGTVRELQQKVAQLVPPAASSEEARRAVVDTVRSIQMIRAYRVRGHLE